MNKPDSKLVEPFVRATYSCFETMVDILPVHKNTSLMVPPMEVTDICALIGLSGDGRGTVGLAMSSETAVKVVSSFVGEPIEEVNKDVFDAIGELINIIAGDAKSAISDMSLSISLPTIMSGRSINLSLPEEVMVINLLFDLPDMGEMTLLVGLTGA